MVVYEVLFYASRNTELWGHAILIGHAEQQLQVKNKQYSINQLDATVKFHNS